MPTATEFTILYDETPVSSSNISTITVPNSNMIYTISGNQIYYFDPSVGNTATIYTIDVEGSIVDMTNGPNEIIYVLYSNGYIIQIFFLFKRN